MIVDGRYSDSRFVASFAGFAPYHQPRIAVVAVFSEVRRPYYHGGQVAAPVFREVVDGALRRLAVPSSLDEVLVAGVRRTPERPDAGKDDQPDRVKG
jgi:cell division protein FtsI (penicillin-binding protein 3)